jgi:hypothetical protein
MVLIKGCMPIIAFALVLFPCQFTPVETFHLGRSFGLPITGVGEGSLSPLKKPPTQSPKATQPLPR